MAEHRYPERTVASPQDPVTVGLRVPHGDGWLGLWVSPARYPSATALIDKYAEAAIEGAAEVRALLRSEHT